MRLLRTLTVLLPVMAFNHVLAAEVSPIPEAPEIDPEFQKVTCRSSFKLTHVPTQYKLHSHEVKYGSGSGQQSVTAVPDKDDTNSLWQVQPELGKSCDRGDPIPCGSVVRLKHVNTKTLLHSHLHRARMSGNLEVSAYEGEDTGDHWIVECANPGPGTVQGDQFWRREAKVRLRHKDTDMFLGAKKEHMYGHPIPGQLEVAGYDDKQHNEQYWTAQEGIYFAEKGM